MSGLARICKAYGSMRVGDVEWVYDYANDKPVHLKDMPKGSDAWKASEKVRWAKRASTFMESAVMTTTLPREQLAAILNNASTEVMK